LKKTFLIAMEGTPQAIERAKAEVQRTLAHRHQSKALHLDRSLVCDTVYAVTEVFQGIACDVHLFTQHPPATDKKFALHQGDTDADIFEKTVDASESEV